MGIADRFDLTVSIITQTRALNAVGSVTPTDTTVTSTYRCMIVPFSQQSQEIGQQLIGVQPSPDMRYGVGEYHASLVRGVILKDTTNLKRYEVLGAHPQKGMVSSPPQHMSFVVKEQPYS